VFGNARAFPVAPRGRSAPAECALTQRLAARVGLLDVFSTEASDGRLARVSRIDDARKLLSGLDAPPYAVHPKPVNS
jgi:hypothetical protein